jgi:hypothetical protein
VDRETYGEGLFRVPVASLQRFSVDTFDAILYFSPLTDGTGLLYSSPAGNIALCDGTAKYDITPKTSGTKHYDCCECFEPSTRTTNLPIANYAEAKAIRCCGDFLLYRGKAASCPHFAGYSDSNGLFNGLPGAPIQHGTSFVGINNTVPEQLEYYLPPLTLPTFVDICMLLARRHNIRFNLAKMLTAQRWCLSKLFFFSGTFCNYDAVTYIKDNCWEHGLVLKYDHEYYLEPVTLNNDKPQLLTNASCSVINISVLTSEVSGTINHTFASSIDATPALLDNWVLDFQSTQSIVNFSTIKRWTGASNKPYFQAKLSTRIEKRSRVYILGMTENLGLGQYSGGYSKIFELVILTDSFLLRNSVTIVGTQDFVDFGVVAGDIVRDSTEIIYRIVSVSGNSLTLDKAPQNSGMRILDNTVNGVCYSNSGVVNFNVIDGILSIPSLAPGDEFIITDNPVYCGLDFNANTEKSSDESILGVTELYATD